MNVFFVPEIESDVIELAEEDSWHAAKVLRLKTGDPVVIVNGRGVWCTAELIQTSPVKCQARIITKTAGFEKREYNLHIAVAPTKNADRIEWFAEKATEIGIDTITPLLCRTSERKNLNTERVRKIATAAMKQSLKAYLPIIDEITPFEGFIQQSHTGKKFIAHCHSGKLPFLGNLVLKGEPVIILIGPEGDFTSEEVNLAVKCGFTEVSLGNSRLRTETAALAACHTIAVINHLDSGKTFLPESTKTS